MADELRNQEVLCLILGHDFTGSPIGGEWAICRRCASDHPRSGLSLNNLQRRELRELLNSSGGPDKAAKMKIDGEGRFHE